MGGQNDGAVILDTKIKTEGFDRGSEELRRATERLSKGLESVNKKLQSVASGYEKALASGKAADIRRLSDGLRQAGEAAAKFRRELYGFRERTFMTDEYKAIQSHIADAQNALDKLLERQKRMDDTGVKRSSQAYRNLAYDIEQARIRLQDAKNDMRWYLDSVESNGKGPFAGGDTTQFDAYQDALNRLSERLAEIREQSKEAFQPQYLKDWEAMPTISGMALDAFDRLKNAAMTTFTAVTNPAAALDRLLGYIAQNALRAAGAVLQMAGPAIRSALAELADSAAEAARRLASMSATAVSGGIKRLGAWLSNAARSMLLFNRATKNNNDVLKRGFTAILKYGLGVRSFYYLFRKIRQAIKEGFENLARYSDRMNQSISGVISSFTKFKNQFAGAFAPLVNAVAPALTRMIDLLSAATFWVGQLLAAFYDQKTVIRAKTVQEDYAESLDKTAKSAKEAKNQLAGFDKLEILKDDGKDKGIDPSDMFEEVPVESSIQDFVGRIKAMWAEGDLTELGGVIGEKIKVALDNIPWDEIKKAAKKTGERLATFLNGLIKVPNLGKSLGKSIAEAINTAFSFLDGFAWRFDWKGLGNAIMDTIEAACDNLDWPLINHALQGLTIGLADLLNTIFSRKETWEKIGKTIGRGFNAAVNAGITFLERFDFNQAARAIVAGLNAAIVEIEWDKIGRFFADYFGGALQFIRTAALEFDWIALGKSFADGLNEFIRVMLDRILGLEWEQIGRGIADGLNAAVAGIGWNSFGTLIGRLIGGALKTTASFIRGLDYGEIVKSIEEFFSSALRRIDFYNLITVWGVAALIMAVKRIIAAHPVLSVLTIAVLALGPELGKVINRMIETIPWAEVGQNISNFLISTLNRLHEAITSVDWFALGKSVGESLGNINWSEIVNSVVQILWDLVVAGIETLAGVIVGMGPKGILNALWAAVKVIAAAIAFGSLFSLISGAISLLFSGIGLLIETSISGVGFLALKAIALLGPLIIKGIGALIALIGKTILFLGGSITSAISGVFTAASTGMASIIATIATAALGVADAFLLIYDVAALKKTANEYNDALKAHNRESENAVNELAKIYREKGPEVAAEWAKTCYAIDITGKSLEEAQRLLTDKVDSLWDDVPQNMWEGFKQGWTHYFGENGKGLSALLGDAFTTAVTFVKERILGEHSPSTVFDDIGQNSALGYIQGFQTRWPELTQFFTDAFGDLKTKFSDGWNNVKTATNEKLSELKRTTLEKWNGVKTDAADKWNEVKASIGNAVSEIKQNASGKIAELSASVKSHSSRTKTDAVNEWNGLKSSVVSSALSVKSQVASAFTSLQGTLSGVWSGIRSAASGAMASVSSMVSSMASSISSRVSSIQSTVSNITSSASNALGRVADKMDDLTRKASNGVPLGGFASGGVITDSGRMSWWDSVQKYASGTLKAAGSLFVAGEAGPEIVGHVNGRTEVLNESQIAGAIYSAVLAAMSEAVHSFSGWLSQQLAANANALIAAIGQTQAPPPIELSPENAALMECVSALSTIPYQAPVSAAGTVAPYEIVAEIKRSTDRITGCMDENAEDIIQAFISAMASQTATIVSALATRNAEGSSNASFADVQNAANTWTRMFGKSPFYG